MKSYGLENPNRLKRSPFVHSPGSPTLQESVTHRIKQTRNPKKVTLKLVTFGKGSDGKS